MVNSLTAVTYGRKKTTPEADFGVVAAGGMRACVYDALSDNTWFDTIGIIAGKNTGTNCTVELAAYDADGSMNPSTRESYTNSFSVTVSKVDDTGGQVYTSSIQESDNGPLQTAMMGYSGNRYALAFLTTVGNLAHSMRAAASVTADNKQFYNRSGLALPPPAPFGSYSSSVEGQMTMWMIGWLNVAPEAPNSGLAPSGSVTSVTPTFTADFKDKNGAYGTSSTLGINSGDKLKTYRMRVQRVSDSLYFWQQTYTATAAEILANAISIVYNGDALSRGTLYQWRCQVADQFGEYSDFSAWTQFTPTSTGYITLDGSSNPVAGSTVQVVSGSTALDFKGKWNHQAASAMTRAQVRLLNQNNTVLQTGIDYDIADVASSALPGTLFTVTWAQSGLATLSWGKTYYFQIRGYDATSWSEWSVAQQFKTNAAPTIPGSLSPNSGTPYSGTNYPLLSCTFTDADDTTATGLTGVFRITKPDTSTVDVTPTYNATTGKWEYQTTITQISAVGTYSWKATGYDGTIYSGEQALLANASFSTSATFAYVTGPTVTVTSPANNSTVTTASLNVAWTVANQVSYQVYVYADNNQGSLIYDSGLITSSTQNHTIPSGYLRNATNYDIVVHIVDTTPADGYSSIVNVLVQFSAATGPANFQATAIKAQDDPIETIIKLSWDQTTYSTPEFQHYILYREANGGPDEASIILKRFSSPASVNYTDVVPTSGWEYTYTLVISILTGVDTIVSTTQIAVEQLDFTGIVLSAVGNGINNRIYLPNNTTRDYSRVVDEATYQSLSRTAPTTIRNKAHYWLITLNGFLIDTDESTAREKKEAFESLDTLKTTICYRDARGRKHFCMIQDLTIKDELPDYYSYTAVLREEHITEGVA